MTDHATLSELHTGALMFGRYELERAISQSASGTTWLARDVALRERRRVVVKRLPAVVQNEGNQASAVRLARLRAKRIPGLPRLEDVRLSEGGRTMVIEWLDGEPLDQLITAHRSLFPTDVARHLVYTLARAVTELHALGFLHLDLTPANIVYDRGQGALRPLDWGYAIALRGRDRPIAVGGELGPVPYLSPSLLAGEAPDPADDAFAVAVIAYELITGVHPYERRSATDAAALGLAPTRRIELTDAENDLFARVLDRRRAGERADLAEIAAVFGPVAPIEMLEPPRPVRRRTWRPVAALAAAAAAVFVAANWGAWKRPITPLVDVTSIAAAPAPVEAKFAAAPGRTSRPESVGPAEEADTVQPPRPPATTRPTIETALSADRPTRVELEKRFIEPEERLVPVVSTAVLAAATAPAPPPPSAAVPPPEAPAPPAPPPPMATVVPVAPVAVVAQSCPACDCATLDNKRTFTNEPLRSEELAFLRSSCR